MPDDANIYNLDQLDGVTATGGPGVSDRGHENGFNTVVDMIHTPAEWPNSPSGGPCECTPESALYVTVDLGDHYYVTGVTLWHYYADGRAYCAQKIALSVNGNFAGEENVVYDTGTEYGPPESADGNAFTFPAYVARYVRHWSAGSTANQYVHFLEIDVYGVKHSVHCQFHVCVVCFCSTRLCTVASPICFNVHRRPEPRTGGVRW